MSSTEQQAAQARKSESEERKQTASAEPKRRPLPLTLEKRPH